MRVAVLGASGFTGKRIVATLLRQVEDDDSISVTVAGRSESKLRELFPGVADVAEVDIQKDDGSLQRLAESHDVLINATGPFRFLGEPVVRACVEGRCHYTDITGEPYFIEKMLLEVDELARDRQVIVVPACGFDCVPADMGAAYIRERFPQATAIEAYLTVRSPAGLQGHFTTFESLVHGVAPDSIRELREQRKRLRRKQEARHPTKRPMSRRTVFWSEHLQRWCMRFPGADPSVVQNSFIDAKVNDRVSYGHYFTVPSSWVAFLFMLFGLLISLLTRFASGRRLLLAFPGIFTFGTFSHKGPSPEQLRRTTFEIDFLARDARNKVIGSGRVWGPEPGYVATPICVVQSALHLARHADKLAPGVHTPATAFSNDPDGTYRQALAASGVCFTASE